MLRNVLVLLLALSISQDARAPKVMRVTAKKFEYSPSIIRLKVKQTVVLEMTALDRTHGFEAPNLKLKATIKPGHMTRLVVTATKTGTFEFHCNVFCGEGHEDMTGQIIVE